MTAREDVERVLAEHDVAWVHDNGQVRCCCGKTFVRRNHRRHLAGLLAGPPADEDAVADTWEAAREAGYAEALIAVERHVKAQAVGMMLDGARFGLADVLDILAHLSDREARP